MNSDNKKCLALQKQISEKGWAKKLLGFQQENGMWGGGLYSPKWISTTYTMLLLKRLGFPAKHPAVEKACNILIDKGFYSDGGINYIKSSENSEICITGMILGLLSYFDYQDDRLHSLKNYLFDHQMPDKGWNCLIFQGDHHSSFHTTIMVLEGLWEYEKRFPEFSKSIADKRAEAHEFLLQHHLYKSDKTGKVVDAKMTRFSFPPRWRYDIMRAMDYFRDCNASYDERFTDAMELLIKKQNADGSWNLQNPHKGRVFFEMEKTGNPSVWNTLRGLRIMKWWNQLREK